MHVCLEFFVFSVALMTFKSFKDYLESKILVFDFGMQQILTKQYLREVKPVRTGQTGFQRK